MARQGFEMRKKCRYRTPDHADGRVAEGIHDAIRFDLV
jgi:hypothetical protein